MTWARSIGLKQLEASSACHDFQVLPDPFGHSAHVLRNFASEILPTPGTENRTRCPAAKSDQDAAKVIKSMNEAPVDQTLATCITYEPSRSAHIRPQPAETWDFFCTLALEPLTSDQRLSPRHLLCGAIFGPLPFWPGNDGALGRHLRLCTPNFQPSRLCLLPAQSL